MQKKNLSFLIQKPFAHRGLWDANVPENSLASFVRAIAHGYAIEMDVRICKDGTPVIIHDSNLSRMVGIKKKVRHCAASACKGMRLCGTDERIATLQEGLDKVAGATPLYIEIKSDTLSYKEKVARIMRVMEHYQEAYVIASLDTRIVAWIQKHYPNVVTAQIFYKNIFVQILWSRPLWHFYGCRGDALTIPIKSVQYAYFQWLRRHGYILLVWTVRNKEEYDRCRYYGDNVVFENFCL